MLRSQLYVPGNDKRKIAKSATLDCDSIVFDLEDAVPEGEKSKAREGLETTLKELEWGTRELGVRVNKLGAGGYSREDIESFRSVEQISFLVLPKAEDSLDVISKHSGKKLLPLIESARGLLQLENIAASEGVFALGYGAADFANSVQGSVEAYLGNVYVKTKLAIVARAYDLAPIDNVFFDIANVEGFRNEANQSKRLGYVGKQVIHPSQIHVANEVFSPSKEEIERAKRIVLAYEEAEREKKTGAIRIDDELVDAVHYRRAKQILGSKD